MKTSLSIAALFALGSFAFAEPTAEKPHCETQCETECASKDPSECSYDKAKFAVTGLEDETKVQMLKDKLSAHGGDMCFCSESGTMKIKYDPAGTELATLTEMVAKEGVTITGQKVAFKVDNMVCGSCSNALSTMLDGAEGVVSVDKACHSSGAVAVTFDPAKTSEMKIKETINASKYQVKEAKMEAAKTDTQSS